MFLRPLNLYIFPKYFVATVQKSIKFGLIRALGFKDWFTGWKVIDILLSILALVYL